MPCQRGKQQINKTIKGLMGVSCDQHHWDQNGYDMACDSKHSHTHAPAHAARTHTHTRTHMSVNHVIEGDRRSLPSFTHARTCTCTHTHTHTHTRKHMSVNYVIEGDRRSLPSFAHAHTCTCTHTHALFNRDKGLLNISIQTIRGALISHRYMQQRKIGGQGTSI